MDVNQEVRKIVGEVIGIGFEEVGEQENLFTDLGYDSIDCVELTMALEERFGLEIPDDTAKDFKTVADVASYVSANYRPQAGQREQRTQDR